MKTQAEAIRTARRVMSCSPAAALGGFRYDATSDGQIVNIRSASPRNARPVVRAKMTESEFYGKLSGRGYEGPASSAAVFSAMCPSRAARAVDQGSFTRFTRSDTRVRRYAELMRVSA